MSTINKTTLEIRIVDVDRRAVMEATVLADGTHTRPVGRGRYNVPNLPKGRIRLRVEAKGYSPVEFSVEVSGKKKYVDVVLGEPGLPTFRRKNVPIPFRSPDDKLGVITRGSKATASVEDHLRKRNLITEHPYGGGLTIVICPPQQRDQLAAELRLLPEVKEVGRLVNPSVRGTGILTRSIMIRTEPGTTAPEMYAAADRASCTIRRKLILKDRWLLSLLSGEGFAVLSAADQLENEPFVIYAEPDIAFTPDPDAINPTDELYDDQWHLTRVNAPDAWQHLRDANPPGVNPGDPGDLTFGWANILLAVMDTGVESRTDGMGVVTPAHPEFQGTVSNGQPKAAFFDFQNMVANNDNPSLNHGTHCAGVAVARANNASVVADEEEGGCGGAPNCRLLGVQGPEPCTEEEFSDIYLWIAGFDPGSPDPAFPAQVAQGADVITNSWGGLNPAVWPISALMDDLFTTITDDGRGGLGTLMFFSTGNAGSGDFWERRPFAAHERNFGIGASNNLDVKAEYSNWGDGVDLCAPSSFNAGLGITTTTIIDAGTLAGHTGGGLDYVESFGGTSSATPLAAGLAALVLSMDPNLTHEEARDVLTKTAKRIDYANTDVDGQWRDLDGDGVNEYSSWYGFGMADAARAVCVARNTITVDPSVAFVDIPEDEPAIRPVTIRCRGWRPRTFHITAGPTTTVGPAGSFVLHAGNIGTYDGSFDCVETHVHIWLRYTGTTAGDIAAGTLTVTCDETGETFDVSLSANTIERLKTALVLALDRSGSMDDPAGNGLLKIELVRDSAAVVPVLCDDGTGLGAVRWDSDADLAGAMGVLDAGNEIGGAGREALTDFINNHNTNILGLTAIGDAVQAAQSLLNDSTGYALEAMCVLTDGNETDSLYLSDLDPDELHSRIYAIGVGTPENLNPGALATIAGSNDGYLLMTGNITEDDSFLLTKYFQQILAGVTNTEITVDPEGWLTPGAVVREPFPVNETDRQVDAIVHCRIPELLKFEIEAPNGQIFGPADATGIDSRFVVGHGSAYYRLDIPSSIVGPQDPAQPWHARIGLDEKILLRFREKVQSKSVKRGAISGTLAHGLRYAFTAQARSSLRMDVDVTQASREPGAKVSIRAQILEYGYPLKDLTKVWAIIIDPKGNKTELQLAPVDGGNYEGSLTANQTGAWRVTVHAAGNTTMSSPFKREAIRSIAVWPGGDRPGPKTSDKDCRGRFFCCLFGRFCRCRRYKKRSNLSRRRLSHSGH